MAPLSGAGPVRGPVLYTALLQRASADFTR